jgi:hypothetical protein
LLPSIRSAPSPNILLIHYFLVILLDCHGVGRSNRPPVNRMDVRMIHSLCEDMRVV